MDLNTVLILAFASAFVVSIVDYWVDLGIARAGVALGACALGTVALNPGWRLGLLIILAASFLAMALLAIIERVNYRPGRTR